MIAYLTPEAVVNVMTAIRRRYLMTCARLAAASQIPTDRANIRMAANRNSITGNYINPPGRLERAAHFLGKAKEGGVPHITLQVLPSLSTIIYHTIYIVKVV